MPDDTEYVLNYINELRRDYGLGDPLNRIPKGYCTDPVHCPIARGLEPARVRVRPVDDVIWFTDLDETVKMPSRISNFAYDFDRGEYPDLIVQSVTE